MNAVVEKSVYEQVVAATYGYLGPAAERFVTREVKAHIGKEPEELTKADVAKLVDWSKLAIALLTDNSKMVEEYADDLLAIANGEKMT